MSRAKPLHFIGASRESLRDFPEAVQDDAGFSLYQIQTGRAPDDWRPMPDIGSGAGEIRIRDAAGIFRVFYVAKFIEAVYVLHCFQKKTPQTAARDIEIGRMRFKQLLKERGR